RRRSANYRVIWNSGRFFRRRISVSRRMACRPRGSPPGISHLYYRGAGRLSLLFIQTFMAFRFSRTGILDGMAEHGLARDLRRHRRRAAEGTTSDGIYRSVAAEARSDNNLSDHWRHVDRGDGDRRRRPIRAGSDDSPGGNYRHDSSDYQHFRSSRQSYQRAWSLELVSLRVKTVAHFRHYHPNV